MYDNETDEKALNEMFSGEPHPNVIFLNSGLWDLLYGGGYSGYVKGIISIIIIFKRYHQRCWRYCKFFQQT